MTMWYKILRSVPYVRDQKLIGFFFCSEKSTFKILWFQLMLNECSNESDRKVLIRFESYGAHNQLSCSKVYES